LKIKLQEALDRRKEVAAKAGAVQIIINHFEQDARSRQGGRLEKPNFDFQKNADGTTLVTATAPTMDKAQVEAEHKFYAMRYRLLDEKIQEANNFYKIRIPKGAIDDAMLLIDDEQMASEKDAAVVERTLSAILRIRKDLNAGMAHASQIPEAKMTEVIKKELKNAESPEALIKDVKKITAGQLLEKYFSMQRQMCQVDNVIHAANARIEVDIPSSVMDEYKRAK